MKKQILSFIIGTMVLTFLFGTLQAQTVTLTFTGKDATTNAYVQLSRIEITNLTKGWTETLTFPDTIAILTVGTGIEENAADAAFCLTQNNPNPFSGTTNVNLTVADAGAVTLEIVDVNGKMVETRHGMSLQPGTHQFRIHVASPGIYFLTARQNGKTSSIKMVCNGNGTGNSIEYMGAVSQSLQTKNGAKGNINRAFAYGDAMTYKGYAEKYGMEIEGEIKAQTQILSETITLWVDYYNDGDPCPSTPTVTDIDGNTYNTVLIGYQCWMKENLRTTKYADNTGIAQGSNDDYSETIAYWYYPDDNSSNMPTYGLLYNWKAVMGNSSSSSANPSRVQGICPNGWHVPSNAEWTQLTDYVSSQSAYVCGNEDTYIAKALASTMGWNSNTSTCAVGNTPTDNNATNFSALPAGSYYGGYYSFGYDAGFWSATESGSSNAYSPYLACNQAYVYRTSYYKSNGYSVRCVRDVTVTTAEVTNITSTTASSGGNIIDDGETTITARGVCWSTSHNPTISDSHTTDGNGTGSFISNLTNLTPRTTYYVRAYATSSLGTEYGQEEIFTTEFENPCPGTPTLTDIDGNTYNTVQIGQQCWMKENLRAKKYADGTSIAQGSSTSTTTGYWYYPNDNSSNMATYGLLYNWKAVMQNSSSSSANPSGVQGICPTGWHVPSDAEWTQLTDYVSSQSEYVCGNDSTYIAKALASIMGWMSSTTTCAVGNTPVDNNATGFSVLPAGGYNGSYYSFGSSAYFWSATNRYSSSACARSLYYADARVSLGNYSKGYSLSVRCVRD